ncbi:MAG: acetate/propionate family kinase [Pseudomonadota bacterium]
MSLASASILTINCGSSSIKFSLYRLGRPFELGLGGKVERIGSTGTCLGFNDVLNNRKGSVDIESSNHGSATNFLIDWLEQQTGFTNIMAVGHRVVHGMHYSQPERISSLLLDELHRISSFDPDHLPQEIELIETFRKRYPELPQIACFDTAFHHTLPRVARQLPIPRRFDANGIQRYGFHGLSYAYLMQELERIAGVEAAHGRVILAHLGNGASLAAVHDGRSVDTSMGFTPAGGLMMGTRPGDLDPGTAWYMMQSENLTPPQFNQLINHECGLLGVSQTSSDMRDLLEREATDVRAAEAVALFCYQVKKWIGAYAAVLGGLDTLVFAGGIGESAPAVRTRICDGQKFLGIDVEEKRNAANAGVISAETSRVAVRVMHTDEEMMIAKSVCQVLGLPIEKESERGNGNETL